MKIGVFSPGRQFGASTISILLSEMLSIKMGTHVTLTGLDPKDETDKIYLDLPETKEITRSLRQVNAMLDVRSITGDEIIRYAIKRGEYFSVLNPVVEDLQQEELTNIVEFIAKSMDNNILVVDANIELGSEDMDRVIDALDYFIIVLSQSVVAQRKLEIWKEKSKSFEEMQEKGIMYVVNNYDNKVSSIRETAKYFELPKNRVCFVPYNPKVKLLSNESNLHGLIEYLEDDDIRFKSLKLSLEELVEKIGRDIGIGIGE